MAPYICSEYPCAYLPETECPPNWQFVGTSLALTIPLFMLHRQRISFNNLKTPPPPRRSNTASSPTLLRDTTASGFSSTSKQGLRTTSELSDVSPSPGMGVVSAMSQMNQSTAFLAVKAFLIATGLVTVGGVVFTWAVKITLGVENVNFNVSFHFSFFLHSDFF